MTENIHFEQDFFSAAQKGLQLLSKSEQESLKAFTQSQFQKDGFFCNAEGKSDLYSTSFGICLSQVLGINENNEVISSCLQRLENGEGFDFLHVSALTRCWRFFKGDSLEVGRHAKIAESLEYNRTSEGLWNQAFGTTFGSIYGTYLAILSYQNLSQSIPDEGKIADGLKTLKSSDHIFGTDKGAPTGTTPATAMATTLLSYTEEPYDFCLSWLLKQQHSDGGFRAVSQMPFSDVQSTVYTIQALKYTAPDELKKISGEIKRFLMSMKKENGFTGHCKDTNTDMENTYFALAGLGMID